MTRKIPLREFLLVSAVAVAASPVVAAEVTPERLANADNEPHNWLMNHRTYDAQRYSPLDKINKSNIANLKLAYAVAIGGTSANENLQATPLAEDGYLYVVDQWGVVYKIDGRSGDMGRILWRMDPGQEKLPLSNRGAALWGNLVISSANYPPRVIATDKGTGKVVWETNLSDGQVDLQLTAAPLAVKDKIIVGAAGGDRGVRDFIAGLDAASGKVIWRKYVIPAPGEPGSETYINWTKGIDPKTGKPIDYDPSKEIQTYAGIATPMPDNPTKRMCPGPSGGNNFWPASYSRKTSLLYIPTATPCVDLTRRPDLSNKAGDWKGGAYKQIERFESNLTVADPFCPARTHR